ncbi:MAG TPA: hypothetical protein VFI31_21875 [Pirellulales bacterium]|nr:hypothetical protein [Pirellulales bacterium]
MIKILARHALTDDCVESSEEELLLEGNWPAMQRRTGRQSFDDAIDSQYGWIDRLAMEFAQQAGERDSRSTRAVTFPYINALALRYYLVKLLRVVAYFRQVRPLNAGDFVALHLTPGDAHYADLIEQLASASGCRFRLHWHDAPVEQNQPPLRAAAWRRWAGCAVGWGKRACERRPPTGREWEPEAPDWHHDDTPRVVVCGNPSILNPVCAELVARGARVWWLHERFAARCWWRWRAAGVQQLTCDAPGSLASSFHDAGPLSQLDVDGIHLTRAVERWLVERAAEVGQIQSLWLDRVDNHFHKVRPTALIVDEDATPFKRLAVALARRYGARSAVVQHGAPCGPFGFAPLAADEIAVWGDSARRQLEAWSVPAERIRLVGWPKLRREFLEIVPSPRPPRARDKRFLLLATLPPRDERPDNVEFHLTSDSAAAMFEMVCHVLSQIESATLTVKLHPRDSRSSLSPCPLVSLSSTSTWANRSVRVVQSHDLASLVAASDCVLSCASTAGTEAALAGAPVVQLLPIGSGNILPADDWGFIGSARTAEELGPLIEQALARGWRKDPVAHERILASYGPDAAARIVDGVLNTRMLSNHFGVAA